MKKHNHERFLDTIRAVESRWTGALGEVAGLLCTVIASRAPGAHRLPSEIGVGPSRTGHWARTPIRAVMSWWAKTSFRAWRGKTQLHVVN